MEREEDNQFDDHAVALMKTGDIIDHVPHSISLNINDPALIRDPAFLSELSTFTPSL